MPESTASDPLSNCVCAEALELLRARFAAVPDIRMAGRVLHTIAEVLMISLCVMLSDNGAFTDMEHFGRSQLLWLCTFLPMPHGPPSHDVLRNVFMASKPHALLAILAVWCGDLAGRQIMIAPSAPLRSRHPV